MFTWSIFVATTILGAPPPTADPVTPPTTARAREDSSSAQQLLTKYQKNWQQPSAGPTEKQDWKVRMECLVGLAKIGPAAVLVLLESLKDEKLPPYTRAFAAQALGFLGDTRARSALLQAIEDKDMFVQAYARKALGRLGRLLETPHLRELAGKDSQLGKYFNIMFLLTRDDEPNPEPIRQALRTYDLARMDSAHLGKPAPDFTLADASGKTWHLRQFRGKKAVVLIFLVEIN
jgi:hypothetical protein